MLTNEKKLIRDRIKAYRRSLSDQKRKDYDNAIFERLVSCGELMRHSLVLCYLSTPIEVDTWRIVSYCMENNIKIAVPKCKDNHKMDFYYFDSQSRLEISPFGIYEPVPDESTLVNNFNNAICIVPALAYDKNGYRLGYGGGFYDSFMEKHENITALGICYSDNFLDSLPREPHDRCVDLIVTDRFTEDLSNG